MKSNQIENLNLDKEEKIIIDKLNKRLINLNKNIDEYFNKSEILSYDSISSAFLSKSDPANLANKYSEVVENFNKMIHKIVHSYQEDELQRDVKQKLNNDKNIISQINKSLENRGEFFIKSTKVQIINLAFDIRKELSLRDQDENKLKQMLSEFDLLIQSMTLLTNVEGWIKVDSISKDLEKIKSLEIKPNIFKKNFKNLQRIIISTAIISSISLIGVQIWMLIV